MNSRKTASANNALAWLWISWVRKYNLSLEILSDVRWEATDASVREQAKFACEYYGYYAERKPQRPRIVS